MEKYTCYECGKTIQTEHTTTIDDKWIKGGGFGSPPDSAIIHLCSEKCENKHLRKSA